MNKTRVIKWIKKFILKHIQYHSWAHLLKQQLTITVSFAGK
jgi:hypothetical protein